MQTMMSTLTTFSSIHRGGGGKFIDYQLQNQHFYNSLSVDDAYLRRI